MSYVIMASALDELFYKQEWELNQVKDASQAELTRFNFALHANWRRSIALRSERIIETLVGGGLCEFTGFRWEIK